MHKEETSKRKQRLIIISRIIFILIALALCGLLSAAVIHVVSERESFKAWVNQYGLIGPFVYMGIVFLQVVIAVIPGEPVELAGGYTFGVSEGTLLYLVGSTLGSLLVFTLVRKYGQHLIEIFYSKKKIDEIRFLKSSKKRNLILVILFIIPGTPKDLLCYFAGLTDISFTVWALTCSFGRLPAILTSAISGNALESENYLFSVIMILITLAISALGVLIYRWIQKRHNH